MSQIKLILGNCAKELKKIPSDSINLIIADPPYDLSKNYGNSSDHQSKSKFIHFSKIWLTECNRILKSGGTIYVFMGMRMISYLYIIMTNLHLQFKSWITWHYTQGVGKRNGYSSRHDDILMFTKSGCKPTFNLDPVRIPQKYYRKRNNMRGANPTNVWTFSHIHYSQKDRYSNPTQKPEGLAERMILASSDINDTVLDPFSGSGTTMRVAEILHRNGIGIELNPTYIQITKHRLQQKFNGFDSIDPHMLRIPRDLNSVALRKTYFKNHIDWFLSNHSIQDLRKYANNFLNLYASKLTSSEISRIKQFKKHLKKDDR